jgi:hypothetical protein
LNRLEARFFLGVGEPGVAEYGEVRVVATGAGDLGQGERYFGAGQFSDRRGAVDFLDAGDELRGLDAAAGLEVEDFAAGPGEESAEQAEERHVDDGVVPEPAADAGGDLHLRGIRDLRVIAVALHGLLLAELGLHLAAVQLIVGDDDRFGGGGGGHF